MGEPTVRRGYFATCMLLSALLPAAGCVKQPGTHSGQRPSETALPGSVLPGEIVTSGNARMVLIPGGEFMMGSDVERDASPPHKVAVSPFYMDRYEVTQELYERITGRNPARRIGAEPRRTCPVDRCASNSATPDRSRTG